MDAVEIAEKKNRTKRKGSGRYRFAGRAIDDVHIFFR
jgi:hypothetical protein